MLELIHSKDKASSEVSLSTESNFLYFEKSSDQLDLTLLQSASSEDSGVELK